MLILLVGLGSVSLFSVDDSGSLTCGVERERSGMPGLFGFGPLPRPLAMWLLFFLSVVYFVECIWRAHPALVNSVNS